MGQTEWDFSQVVGVGVVHWNPRHKRVEELGHSHKVVHKGSRAMEGVGEEALIGGLWSFLKLDNEYIIRFRPAN